MAGHDTTAFLGLGPKLPRSLSRALRSAKPVSVSGTRALLGTTSQHAASTLTGPLSFLRTEMIGILPSLVVMLGPMMGEAAGIPQSIATLEVKLNPQELSFQREKQAFLLNLSPETLAKYSDQFVASRDGRIVDSDLDLSALTTRFFGKYGDVPVYIVKIGGQKDDLRVDTPFFDNV